MTKLRNLAFAVVLPLLLNAPQAIAACNESSIAHILDSSLDDKRKLVMLRSIGCQETDLDKLRTEKTERDRKSAAEFAASVEESNAEKDAFNQEMADKCGEYPLELKIGMSEKLLKIGCAGQADLVGEEKNARVYRMYGVLVSVYKGKVVRWIHE